MLRKLPVDVQHAALVLIVALLTWGGQNLDSLGLPAQVVPFVSGALVYFIAFLNKDVTAFGRGSETVGSHVAGADDNAGNSGVI